MSCSGIAVVGSNSAMSLSVGSLVVIPEVEEPLLLEMAGVGVAEEGPAAGAG
jgi:hypothetical protein